MINLRLAAFFIVLGVGIASWALTCAAWRYDRVAAGVMPLDPREFPRLTAITVGTGGAYENPNRRGPATVVALGADLRLVDVGRGVSEALRLARIPVSQVEVVLLTNLLGENTMGLDDLLLTGWRGGRKRPLRVVGPPGTRALAESLQTSHARGIAADTESLGLDPAAARFEVEEIADGWTETAGQLQVRAGALPGGPLEAFAYRFEAQDRSIVVGGTGWAPDALVAFGSGANLLIHEAVFVPTPEIAAEIGLTTDPDRLRREAALHTSVEDIGPLAARAGVETLVLVRLRPPPVFDIQLTRLIDDGFGGRIVIPDDGDELTP